ncbi:hypothetical protein HDU81_006898 [Chytriomyces hyalinus]|nr:hypothetical protein HDU81_006898 [Chytriomyces hyalinus]
MNRHGAGQSHSQPHSHSRGGGGGRGRGGSMNGASNRERERDTAKEGTRGSWSNGPPAAALQNGHNGHNGQAPHKNSRPHPNSHSQPPINDTLSCLFLHLVGTHVTATSRDGTVYEGILHTLTTSPELGVVLAVARVLSKPESTLQGKNGTAALSSATINSLVILPKDLVALTCLDADLSHAKDIAADAFQTDAAIGARMGEFGKERELVQWADDAVEDENRENSLGSAGTKWDQFAANERLFGVETDFREEIYTTIIDKSDPNFKKKEAEALRLAKEIESGFGKTDNIHLLEERNLIVPDDGTNEEDKYSSVIRKSDQPKPDNVYIPPAARKANSKSNINNVNHGNNRTSMPSSSSKDSNKPKPEIAVSTTSKPPANANNELKHSLKTAPATSKAIEIPDPANVPQHHQQPRSKSPSRTPNLQSAKLSANVPQNGGSKSGRVSPATDAKKSSPTASTAVSSGAEGGRPGVAAALSYAAKVAAERGGKKEDSLGKLPAKSKENAASHGRDFVGESYQIFQKFAENQRMQIKKPLREAMTKSKPEMLSELKAFSTDFKLPMPFPADLKDIIKKVPESQPVVEGTAAAGSSSSTHPTSSKSPSLARPASFNARNVSEKAGAPVRNGSVNSASATNTAGTVPSSAGPAVPSGSETSAAATQKDEGETGTSEKSASKFKFNLSAVEFTPSFGPSGSSPVPQSQNLNDKPRPQSMSGTSKGPVRNNSGGYAKGYQKNYGQQHFRPQFTQQGYDENGGYMPQMDPNQPFYYPMQGGPYPAQYRPIMPGPRPGFMPPGMHPSQAMMGPGGVQYMMPYGVPPGAMMQPMMGMPGVPVPMYVRPVTPHPAQPNASQPSGAGNSGKNGPPTPTSTALQMQPHSPNPSGTSNAAAPSQASGGTQPQMIPFRPPPQSGVPISEGYVSPQNRSPYMMGPPPPGHDPMYPPPPPGMMGYPPPQGYYPGHPGMMVPMVWTGDPMQMAEMQQHMMQPGMHPMPMHMMAHEMHDGEEEELEGEELHENGKDDEEEELEMDAGLEES